MNELLLNEDNIKSRIYTLRNMQVMLDKDLAELYGVKAIRLREQVKRNIDRFPDDFMFHLSDDEVEFMVSQNAIPSRKHLGGSLPYVFTEQGVSSLSSVLTSKIAVQVHINIMRAFVNMRKFISNNAFIFQRLESLEQKQFKTDEKFEKLFDALEDKSIKLKQGIYFDGQIFDAYAFISELIRKAQKSIILIDNYCDDTTLIHLSKADPKVKITLLSKTITKQLKLDIEKYNAQYKNLEAKEFNSSHDRFLILDEKEIYHIGASLKDLGKKWFVFSLLEVESFGLMGRVRDIVKDKMC